MLSALTTTNPITVVKTVMGDCFHFGKFKKCFIWYIAKTVTDWIIFFFFVFEGVGGWGGYLVTKCSADLQQS